MEQSGQPFIGLVGVVDEPCNFGSCQGVLRINPELETGKNHQTFRRGHKTGTGDLGLYAVTYQIIRHQLTDVIITAQNAHVLSTGLTRCLCGLVTDLYRLVSQEFRYACSHGGSLSILTLSAVSAAKHPSLQNRPQVRVVIIMGRLQTYQIFPDAVG